MRALVLVLLVALAGCTAAPEPEPSAEPLADLVPEPVESVDSFNSTAAYLRNNTCAKCDYDDGQYHQYVLYDPEDTSIDILVLPAASVGVEDTAVARAAVADWQRGLDAWAPEWLQEGLSLNIYAVGIDIPSPEVVTDPEIIVVLAYADRSPTGLYLGIGLEPEQNACSDVWTLTEPGVEMVMQRCTDTGYRCIALNTIPSDTPDRITNLVVHEFGHCLGAGHVGNAGPFSSKIYPHMDAMSYGGDRPRTRCVSNMNIELLSMLYAPLLDQDGPTVVAGDDTSFEPTMYRQGSCSPAEAHLFP